MRKRNGKAAVFMCVLALLIPALLAGASVQARRYADMEAEVSRLEKKQLELIEDSRKLITGITLLSSADRIEKLASENLHMRRAESSEIIRIEMRGTPQ